MSNPYPELVKKGLTEEEAKTLGQWIEEGKPGLTQYKAERLGQVFCLGYSCQDIQRWFPEYPIAILLYARVQYHWDELRDRYRSIVQQETLNAALAARMESIRFLSDVLTAVHLKWRKEVLAYIADPDQASPPSILPNNIHTYNLLLSMLKEVATPNQSKNNDENKSTPLVSVTVNPKGKDEVVVTSNGQEAIKQALMDDLKKS